ncbi:MAG: two-component system OmpR family sensor kinase [Sulfurimonas sp.]
MDIRLSKVELESFLKSFLLFFSSLSILITTLFYLNYNKDIKRLDDTLFGQMKVCSFSLQCPDFTIDFVSIDTQKVYTLYKSEHGLEGFFPVSQANDYYLRLHFSQEKHIVKTNEIKNTTQIQYFIILSIVLILSILFSLYALYPLRSALLLTQEFIKDILHDFNTPLSALRLNSFMLQRELGKNEKLSRIEQSVQNILNLQENLKAYLYNYEKEKENISLKELIHERITAIEDNYTDIKFIVEMQNSRLQINKNALSRVLDNVISNAAKYNKKNGKITITYDEKTKILTIQDTGKGIENPSKIFQRFYKEQERGIGIGLHIVKKLCDELKIKINVRSKLNIGTTFTFELTNY